MLYNIIKIDEYVIEAAKFDSQFKCFAGAFIICIFKLAQSVVNYKLEQYIKFLQLTNKTCWFLKLILIPISNICALIFCTLALYNAVGYIKIYTLFVSKDNIVHYKMLIGHWFLIEKFWWCY